MGTYNKNGLSNEHEHRLSCARLALKVFSSRWTQGNGDYAWVEPQNTRITDLITDLLHLIAAEPDEEDPITVRGALARSQRNFLAEQAEGGGRCAASSRY